MTTTMASLHPRRHHNRPNHCHCRPGHEYPFSLLQSSKLDRLPFPFSKHSTAATTTTTNLHRRRRRNRPSHRVITDPTPPPPLYRSKSQPVVNPSSHQSSTAPDLLLQSSATTTPRRASTAISQSLSDLEHQLLVPEDRLTI